MYKAKINNDQTFETEIDKDGKSAIINNKETAFELFREHRNIFQVLKDNKTFEVLVLKFNPKEKTLTLKVNGNRYDVVLKDKYDDLLAKLGMDINTHKKVSNVKAPMPGLVLNVLVQEGSTVKKGDALIVLEAMKMENILKSPADGNIKKVSVKKGTAVEKNQILIEF